MTARFSRGSMTKGQGGSIHIRIRADTILCLTVIHVLMSANPA